MAGNGSYGQNGVLGLMDHFWESISQKCLLLRMLKAMDSQYVCITSIMLQHGPKVVPNHAVSGNYVHKMGLPGLNNGH